MKQIQIDEKLFFDIMRYILITDEGNKVPNELRNKVVDGLCNKIDSITKRKLYQKYKTAATEEEREKARQEYLENKGINFSL